MSDDISRVERGQEQAREYYDRLSKKYDRMAGRWERPHRRHALSLLSLHQGDSILEIGCGTGDALVDIAREVLPGGQVTGIDISSGMLEVAQHRLIQVGLDKQIKLVCGNALSLPFPDAVFDAVFICFTLELFDTPEIPLVLSQCQRVLKAGGSLAVVSLAKTDRPGLAERIYEWAHRKFPRAVDCRPIRVLSSVTQAGFDIRQNQRTFLWGIPLDTVIGVKKSPVE